MSMFIFKTVTSFYVVKEKGKKEREDHFRMWYDTFSYISHNFFFAALIIALKLVRQMSHFSTN